MAGVGPGDLHLLAQELLDAAEAALDTIPSYEVNLKGAPARAFVSPGEPALDCCPQLTVHVAGSQHISPVGGLPAFHQKDRVSGPTLQITMVRCIPADEQPPTDEMQDAAEQINADGWALWNHLFNLWSADDLFTLCGVLSLDLLPQPPSGGCAGWRLNVRTNLDGYQEVIGS